MVVVAVHSNPVFAVFSISSLLLASAAVASTNAQLLNFGSGATLRKDIPECANACTFTTCIPTTTAGGARPDLTATRACITDCQAREALCASKLREAQKAAFDAQLKAQQEARDKAAMELGAQAGAGTGTGAGGPGQVGSGTPEQWKTRCNDLCTKLAPDAAKERCSAACGQISTPQGIFGAIQVIQGSLRAKWDEARKATTGDEAKQIAQKIQDTLATQRALFDADREKRAAALDKKGEELKLANADRIAALQASRDAISQFFKDLKDAKTPEERQAIIDAARKAIQDKVAAAKKAAEERRAELQGDAKALVDKILAAKKDAAAADRKVLIIKIKALQGSLADFLESLKKNIDADADATAVAKTKRNGGGCVAVVTVNGADESAGLAVNNIVSGFVATADDATVTETAVDQVDETAPDVPTELQATVETTKASTGPVVDKVKDTNGAASLVLGVVAIVCSALTMF